MATYDALTREEKAFVKQHISDMSVGEIAHSLGRSYYTVLNEMRRIGYRCYHKWTAEEDVMLMSLWGEYSAENISKMMQIDKDSIYNRVRTMKRNGKWNA